MILEEGHVLWLRLPFDKNYNEISKTRHPYIIIKRTNKHLHLLQADSYTNEKIEKDRTMNKNRTQRPFVDELQAQPGLLNEPGYVQMDNIITIDNIENEKTLVNNKKILRTKTKLEERKLKHLQHNYQIKIKIKKITGQLDTNKIFHVPLPKLIELENEQEEKEEAEKPIIATSYPFERKNRNKNNYNRKGNPRK